MFDQIEWTLIKFNLVGLYLIFKARFPEEIYGNALFDSLYFYYNFQWVSFCIPVCNLLIIWETLFNGRSYI